MKRVLYVIVLVLCNLNLSAYEEFIDPNPSVNNGFGSYVEVLINGNVVITSPFADINGETDCGAVYLYSGSGTLISTLSSSKANDKIGSDGIVQLENGNYLIFSPLWDNGTIIDAGAVTFGNKETGINGTVTITNSLVGASSNDLENCQCYFLNNGNFLIISYNYNNGEAIDAGAVTFGDKDSGVSGIISNLNSLVGSHTDDFASFEVVELSNGNIVLFNSYWDNGESTNAGAVTWCNSEVGISGTISSSNSLIGSSTDDLIGEFQCTELSNGNFIIRSPFWNNGEVSDAGAVTWVDCEVGLCGVVSSSNSLVGSNNNDNIGIYRPIILANGNYVTTNPDWDNAGAIDAGAVTWCNGTTATSGVISSSNSLIGEHAYDLVGNVTALPNGNYVVISSEWDDGAITNVGAVTWANGTGGITGTISSTNSLIGSHIDDLIGSEGIEVLPNSNYIIVTPRCSNGDISNAGAVTWANGTIGITGTISSSNSLIGSHIDDRVGIYGIDILGNGNYVVKSGVWNNGELTAVGAVTLGDGANGISGIVSSSNSLIGSSNNDYIGNHHIIELSNGNVLIISPDWDNGSTVNVGAVTRLSATIPFSGEINTSNSLIGNLANDYVGDGGVEILANGNYLILSPNWHNLSGAVTFCELNDPVFGTVHPTNSLYGLNFGNRVGSDGIVKLQNSNYIVKSSYWGSNRGAVTLCNGEIGLTGYVDFENSLTGANIDDRVGQLPLTVLSNGNYVVRTPNWDNNEFSNAGAVTLCSGSIPTVDVVSSANSLVGSNTDDKIGLSNINVLENGNYIVKSSLWNNGDIEDAGAVTLCNYSASVRN